MQAPSLVGEPIPAAILSLLPACESGQLAVCVGAGLSVADDAALPLASHLAKSLSDRLDGRLSGYTPPDPDTDIVLVADAAVAASEGIAALQSETLGLADFTGAKPNLGHRALALLLAEGAVASALSWNWDTCIERAAPHHERLEVALTASDIADLEIPAVLKVHGCATRRSTLLITSTQLAEPPAWVDRALLQRLVSNVLVFVGIGDVADYAAHRMTDLFHDLGDLRVVVVGPSIVSNWDKSKWASTMPTLADETDRRVELDADTFFDALLRAWVSFLLLAAERVRDEAGDPTPPSIELVVRMIERTSALHLALWCRSSLASPRVGHSAVRAPSSLTLLLAAATLAASDGASNLQLRAQARIQWKDRTLAALAVPDHRPAATVRRDIEGRAQRLAEAGMLGDSLDVLVAGTVVGSVGRDFSLGVADVFAGTTDADDLIAGPTAIRIFVTSAEAVLGDASG